MRRASESTRGLFLCLAAAAALRAGFILATRHDPVFRIPDLDEAFYHLWARSLAEQHGDFQGPYFVGPLYPHAVSLLYSAFGPKPFAVRIAQSLLGVFDAGLLFTLGRRLFGPWAAYAAVALAALYGPLVFDEGLLLLETLLLSLVLAGLWALLVPRWSQERRGALAGLCLGLAALVRPTVLAVAPVALAALRNGGAGTRLRRTRGALACLGVWIAVLSPVLARNVRLGGGPTLTTNMGVNFYAGNSPGADGRFHEPPGVQFFRSPMLIAAGPGASLPPEVARRALTVRGAAGTDEAADSGLWMRRAGVWIRAHPGDFVALTLRKLWLLVQADEVSQIESYAFQRQRLPALRLFCVDFTWLWPLTALGIWCAWRERRRGAGIAAGFAATLLLPCVVFFVTSRHRLVAVPELALFAGYGAATLATWCVARRGRRVGVALAAIVPLGVLTRLEHVPTSHGFGWENVQMADRQYALGDLEGAIRFQEQAARALPELPEVAMPLALYWSERQHPGDLARAEMLLRTTAVRAPQAAVWFNLGVVLVRQGRAEEARAAWQQALALDPDFEPARARLRAAGIESPDGRPSP